MRVMLHGTEETRDMIQRDMRISRHRLHSTHEEPCDFGEHAFAGK
jgi:hypothetical protein